MPVDASPTPEIFQLTVEASPSGLVVVNGAGTIVMVNGEIERLFGYRREELIGQTVEILLPAYLRDKHTGQRINFMLQPRARRLGTGRDFLGRHRDGAEFPVEVGLNPLHINGEVMVLCAIGDVSERKRLERLQDEFVTTVSHELRTPMTSIAGSLGLLMGGAAGVLPQSAAHLIDIAHANCRRLVRLVNDILDIKKLELGRSEFNFQRCPARALVEQAIEANRGFADAHGVLVRLVAAAEPFEVEVDPDRFIQVVTNLLSNALKFSPSGEEVVVSLERSGSNIRIALRDHGPGIPPAFKPRIFEKFAQGGGPNGRQKSGTGLGLSIVRQIVMHMHGQVGFDDAPGGGAIFYVDLPAAGDAAGRVADLTIATDSTPLGPEADNRLLPLPGAPVFGRRSRAQVRELD